MVRKSGSFRVRSFVAATALLSGLSLPISGLANHLYGPDEMNDARHAWMALHNVLALIFLVFVIWHVVLNFRGLKKHIKGAVARVQLVSRETLVAVALVAIAVFASVGHAVT
jgi:hypothetical protein